MGIPIRVLRGQSRDRIDIRRHFYRVEHDADVARTRLRIYSGNPLIISLRAINQGSRSIEGYSRPAGVRARHGVPMRWLVVRPPEDGVSNMTRVSRVGKKLCERTEMLFGGPGLVTPLSFPSQTAD